MEGGFLVVTAQPGDYPKSSVSELGRPGNPSMQAKPGFPNSQAQRWGAGGQKGQVTKEGCFIANTELYQTSYCLGKVLKTHVISIMETTQNSIIN